VVELTSLPRDYWPYGLTMDDTLWSLALASGRHMKEVHKPAANTWTHDERAMWHLLEGGLFDARVQDKPWDASTRLMKYTAELPLSRLEGDARDSRS